MSSHRPRPLSREAFKVALGNAGKIPPKDVPLYSKSMEYYWRMAENLAPELFRLLGWSVAIAAVRVVSLRVDGGVALRAIPYVLAWALATRIVWFFGPRKSADVPTPDGGLQAKITKGLVLSQVALSLFAAAGAYFIAFSLAGAFARSDMLDKVFPESAGKVTVPVAGAQTGPPPETKKAPERGPSVAPK